MDASGGSSRIERGRVPTAVPASGRLRHNEFACLYAITHRGVKRTAPLGLYSDSASFSGEFAGSNDALQRDGSDLATFSFTKLFWKPRIAAGVLAGYKSTSNTALDGSFGVFVNVCLD